jgi:hypothetical protein
MPCNFSGIFLVNSIDRSGKLNCTSVDATGLTIDVLVSFFAGTPIECLPHAFDGKIQAGQVVLMTGTFAIFNRAYSVPVVQTLPHSSHELHIH